jgi:hypothetical protein
VIVEHAAAVLALLNGIGKPAAIRVDSGVTPSPLPDVRANPYMVVSFDSNDPESDKEARPYLFVMTATIHSVGGSAEASMIVADWARTALYMVQPVVSGRSCYPIARETGGPPRRDESTGSLVMDQADVYVLQSIPG